MVVLDIRTLAITTSLVGGVLGAILLAVYLTRKTYRGFGCWVLSSLLMGGGMLLVAMRQLLPEIITVFGANILFIISFSALNLGIHRFLGTSRPAWFHLLPALLSAVAFYYFTFIEPSVSLRIIIISALAGLYFFEGAFQIWVAPMTNIAGQGTLVLIPLIVLGLYGIVRLIYTTLFELGIDNFLTASAFQAMSFLIIIGGNTSLYVGLIILNSQRTEHALVETNASLKTLEGIIPICMHCKQIRDDQGYWNKLEAYISSHTEAQFSHSVCDLCMDKFYKDLND